MIRYNPEKEYGLNSKQVEERINNKLVNYNSVVPTKTTLQIISTNIFTLFNFINFVLALAIILVKSYINLLFMGVIVCNTLISIIQEIRAKRTIDKLTILSASKVKVIRDSNIIELNIDEIVLDDLISFEIGSQIVVDSIIIDGECEVDESFISGEAKTIYKKVGDILLSGSFIVSGKVIAKVEHIGLDNHTSKISKEAKYLKKVKSEILLSLNKILKVISIVIIPVGLILFFKQINISGNTITSSVVNTVAALISMIPDGLMLLSSTVFAVAIIRLAKYKVLVKELYSIETIARIDTLCLDKTGTITNQVMEVKDVIKLNNDYDINNILSNFAYSFDSVNSTLKALQNRFERKDNLLVLKVIPFSSIKKWSLIETNKGSYILGAPEFILKDTSSIDEYLNKYSLDYRVLLLAYSNELSENKKLPDNIKPLALILIEDNIREEAPIIIDYFDRHGVDIKIISGDNPITVRSIAKRSGVKNYDKYIDLSKEKNPNYDYLVKNYTIFGRVDPYQKKELILALKKNGKVVGMTGDGVNDVLALKEADTSISFGNATEAARNVSQIILLDTNFSSVKEVVKEGRRTINNIERSSMLFLVKTIFATILAIIFLFVSLPYPFIPIQLSLTSSLTIGIPSLILALEANHDIVRGKFLTNVISKSLPAGLTMVINIVIILILSQIFHIDIDKSSTMCVISNAAIGFMLLYKISKPFNLVKKTLFLSMLTLFILESIILKDIFALVALNIVESLSLIVILLMSYFYMKQFYKLYEHIVKRYPSFFE